MPDGGPVITTSPWADHKTSGERPVTRSSSRGESRNGRRFEQQRTTVTQGLKGVEPPPKNVRGGITERSSLQSKNAGQEEDVGETNSTATAMAMKTDETTGTANAKVVAAAPTKPAAGSGGAANTAAAYNGGRKLKDPSSPSPATTSAASSPTSQTPTTAVSSTSSKPVKALLNEMKKACRSRNILIKQTHPASTANGYLHPTHSITCETTFSATSPLLVFTMEVSKLGDLERMNVCKGTLMKGKKGEFEKVCKVLFAAMKLL